MREPARTRPPRTEPWEWWTLAALCGVYLSLKSAYSPDLRLALDGSYYVNVARHVAEGQGLQTTVSLYHHGYQSFPHATPIYPLWPLVLGGVGAVIGLDAAVRFLPVLLALADLVLVFLLARAIASRSLPRRSLARSSEWSGVVGLALVALLASNHVFFRVSSLPYTEALALAFSFGALLAVDAYAREPRTGKAAIAGALAALAYLARAHCAAVVLGILAALALAGVRDRGARRAAAVFAGVATAVIVPWVAYLASILEPFEPRVLLDFASYRETPALEPFSILVETHSAIDFVRDRAEGVLTAFDPGSTLSYVWNWGPVAFAIPIGVILAASRPRDTWRRLRRCTDPESLPIVACFLVGAASILPIHLLHSAYWYEWWFGQRYGIFLAFLLLVAIPYLGGASRAGQLAAAGLIGASLLHGGRLIREHIRLDSPDPSAGLLALEAWLATRPEDDVFLAVDPQPLSLRSRAGFHWIHCQESADHTRDMLRSLPVDYVILFPSNRGCPFTEALDGLGAEIGFGARPQRIEVRRVEP